MGSIIEGSVIFFDGILDFANLTILDTSLRDLLSTVSLAFYEWKSFRRSDRFEKSTKTNEDKIQPNEHIWMRLALDLVSLANDKYLS